MPKTDAAPSEPTLITIPLSELELVQIHSRIEDRLASGSREPIDLIGSVRLSTGHIRDVIIQLVKVDGD